MRPKTDRPSFWNPPITAAAGFDAVWFPLSLFGRTWNEPRAGGRAANLAWGSTEGSSSAFPWWMTGNPGFDAWDAPSGLPVVGSMPGWKTFLAPSPDETIPSTPIATTSPAILRRNICMFLRSREVADSGRTSTCGIGRDEIGGLAKFSELREGFG